MTSSNGRRPGKRPATSQGWQHGPAGDEQVRRWLADIGVPSIVDIHVHFMPDSVLRKVWAFFDDAKRHYGTAWPVRYREPEQRRLAILRELGVRAFAPLVYPHKPGMARWLNSWVAEFAAATPEAVRTATVYPEPEVAEYLADALAGGARCVKAHVQVGGYDPRDPLLD
ncbi:MAG: amidohydrolase, partial [Sciscionella sp.]|nr:amidohydrolase [Sciscionella sp.]